MKRKKEKSDEEQLFESVDIKAHVLGGDVLWNTYDLLELLLWVDGIYGFLPIETTDKIKEKMLDIDTNRYV